MSSPREEPTGSDEEQLAALERQCAALRALIAEEKRRLVSRGGASQRAPSASASPRRGASPGADAASPAPSPEKEKETPLRPRELAWQRLRAVVGPAYSEEELIRLESATTLRVLLKAFGIVDVIEQANIEAQWKWLQHNDANVEAGHASHNRPFRVEPVTRPLRLRTRTPTGGGGPRVTSNPNENHGANIPVRVRTPLRATTAAGANPNNTATQSPRVLLSRRCDAAAVPQSCEWTPNTRRHVTSEHATPRESYRKHFGDASPAEGKPDSKRHFATAEPSAPKPEAKRHVDVTTNSPTRQSRKRPVVSRGDISGAPFATGY